VTVHAIHTCFDRDGNPHSDQKDRNSKEHYPKCVHRGAEKMEEAAPSESFSSSWTCCTEARDSDLPFFRSQVLNVEKRIRPQLITSAWREVNRRGNKQKKKWKGLQRRKSLVPFDQSTCEGFSELSVCLWGTLQINRSRLFPGCIFSKSDGNVSPEKGKKYTLTRSLELKSMSPNHRPSIR